MFFLIRDATFSFCRKYNLLVIDGVCTQIHLPHATFVMHSHCTACSLVCVQLSRASPVAQEIGSFVPHKNKSHLRAMSYTVQHATPTTDTSSSSSAVPRSLSHCAHVRPPLECDSSPELPLPTGYEPNWFVAIGVVDDYGKILPKTIR